MKYGGCEFEVGRLVFWVQQEIHGVCMAVEGRNIHVLCDDLEERIFTADSDAIFPVCLEPGDRVQLLGDPEVGIVVGTVEGSHPPLARVFYGGKEVAAAEGSMRPAVLDDPVERLVNGQLGKALDFNLKSVAADLWLQHLHNPLVSLAHSRVDLRPHQVSAVHRTISNYPHRFLLCDEVGLGKTIEAAMVVKELRARKQAARVLILVPSGLLRQWQFELKTKFNESFAVYNRATVDYLKNQGVDDVWRHHDSVIASHTWTSWSKERREAIARVDWDLIIVDEAHHARRQKQSGRISRTNLYRLVEDLTTRPEFSRRAVLFLTATPMQLQHHELYSLVEMVDPILFASEDDFQRHINDLSGLNQTVEILRRDGYPAGEQRARFVEDVGRYLDIPQAEAEDVIADLNAEDLAVQIARRHRLSEVMIRNRRSVVGGFLPRTAVRWEVDLTETEREIQTEMGEILRIGFELSEATSSNAIAFLMTTFQKLAASSSRALRTSLVRRRTKLAAGTARAMTEISVADAEERLDQDDEAADIAAEIAPGTAFEIEAIDHVISLLGTIKVDSKARVLAEQLYALFREEGDEKVIIFTEFRETQEMLFELLSGSGWGVHRFHGQLSPLQKEASVEDFKNGEGPQILVSTEAGGEGRNFQFCHFLVNYDLPWNPMKVEQRIGRVDRIGQVHPVVVFNFHVKDTIESRVLDVLEYRIGLFENSVGGLEPILGETEGDIRKALQLSADARDRAFSELAGETERKIAEARRAETELADFIMDSKSFSAEIARIAAEAEAPITNADFEAFLLRLLGSENTYIKGPDEKGVYKLMFHPPFAVARTDLVDGRPKRRACFNPHTNVDSENVEYMGFGHPIIDELVRMSITESLDGAAAVRRVPPSICEEPGFQFNFLIKIGSVRPRTHLHAVFVSEDGSVDAEIGLRLLEASRRFRGEELATPIPVEGARRAFEVAELAVAVTAEELRSREAERVHGEADVDSERIEQQYRHRMMAAQDRIHQSDEILERMKAAEDEGSRATIPMWEANLKRAEAELDQIRDDREDALRDLEKRRNPTFQFDLLNVARIEPEKEPSA